MRKQDNQKNGRVGTTLANPKAHQLDHDRHGRRDFLRSLGLIGAGGLMLNKLPVTAAAGSTSLANALTNADSDRILVMIRLNGGNDGLNTIIPLYDFSTYQAIRPDIRIPEAETWALNGALGVTNNLSALQPMWNDGKMKVVNNIGYPAQNLSHFRSSDIWATSSDSDVVIESGWLGRMIEDEFPDFLTNPPTEPPAIQIGGTSNLVFNNSNNFNYAISTNNPEQLYQIAQTGQLYDVNDVPDCTHGEQLSYLRAVANTTFSYAGRLAEAFDEGANSNEADYMSDRLGDQLALIARLIKGGLGTRLYMVELDGFDTHANQPDWHAYLMQSLGQNTSAFFTDLETGGHGERTLAMTFSEFGRRPEQNGSMGTDHGAAAPMMLFGAGLNGNGILGGLPNLQNLDQAGNMIYSTDFRSVYATIMDYWLCLGGETTNQLLGGDFDRLEAMGLFCSPTSTTERGRIADIGLLAHLNQGELVLKYNLPTTGNVVIRTHDALGRIVATPFNGNQFRGEQEMRLPLSVTGWAAGVYIVSVESGGQMYSKRVTLF
ncbi:hypothetical protein CEQ90_16175 [Lewinellaceae bacterium SD302]|nr:hypothetical protein CEQ90_16175 [Lewinellaceae bacterium SD302]